MSEDSSQPALFREYPELKEKIPWLALGMFPTPVLKAATGVESRSSGFWKSLD
jgi:hypothetical protein